MVCGLTLENLHKPVMRSVAWPLQRETPLDCEGKCEMFTWVNLFHMLVSMLVKWSPCFYTGRRDFDSFNTHINSSQCLPDSSGVCRQKWVSTATMFSHIWRCSHADILKKNKKADEAVFGSPVVAQEPKKRAWHFCLLLFTLLLGWFLLTFFSVFLLLFPLTWLQLVLTDHFQP